MTQCSKYIHCMTEPAELCNRDIKWLRSVVEILLHLKMYLLWKLHENILLFFLQRITKNIHPFKTINQKNKTERFFLGSFMNDWLPWSSSTQIWNICLKGKWNWRDVKNVFMKKVFSLLGFIPSILFPSPLFISLFILLSRFLTVYLSTYLSFYLSTDLSIDQLICLAIYLIYP